MKDLTFAQESLTVMMWPELLPLVKAHYEEIAHHKDIALDPGIAAYANFIGAGMLRLYTVRDLCGTLHGYAVFIVSPNIHYQGCLQANQDVLYVRPEKRGWTGIKFLKWIDKRLKKDGVQLVRHHLKAKEGQNFGKVLERMGYELVDLVYDRRL